MSQAQVDIVHVPANKKNAADEKLKQLMRRFADILPSYFIVLSNLIIFRFADIHRGGGARIVLISGDRDFAADIADYKRRMRLSVILLHTNNCPQSLILAASEHYNFQELLSSVPVETRHTDITGRPAQVYISGIQMAASLKIELKKISQKTNGILLYRVPIIYLIQG